MQTGLLSCCDCVLLPQSSIFFSSTACGAQDFILAFFFKFGATRGWSQDYVTTREFKQIQKDFLNLNIAMRNCKGLDPFREI